MELLWILLLLSCIGTFSLGINPVSLFGTPIQTGSLLSDFNTSLVQQSFHENIIDQNKTSSGVKVGVMSWNLAEKCTNLEDCKFLREFYDCDIIVLGIQECEDIRPRRNEGHRSRKWREIYKTLLGKKYKYIASHKLGGMQLTVLGNKRGREIVDGIQIIDVACGVGNVLSNKGGICILLHTKGKTLALVNAHLAAHQTKVSWGVIFFFFFWCY